VTHRLSHLLSLAGSDPVLGTAQQHKLTFLWEAEQIGRPGVSTFGLNGTQGLYSRMNWAATANFPSGKAAAVARGQVEPPVHIGTSAPRASGGFTVYRHDHWCLAGTQLQYGDLFGETVPLLACEIAAGSSPWACSQSLKTRHAAVVMLVFVGADEVDGLDYLIADGMPEPTGRDGADMSAIEIIAMGLAFNGTIEETTDPGTLRALALVRYGDQSPESLRKAGRGNGMLVEYRVGSKGGVVIAAGSTEWILGLRPHIERNEPVDTDAALITQNVLNRAISRATPASRL
jgi:hypothetical protein